MVDYLGRLRDVCKAVEPAGDSMANSAIFVEVSKAMGSEVKEATAAETSSLSAFEAKAAFSDFAKRDGLCVKVDEMIESINASVINGSRLLWLKEGAACTA
jgi:predicted molibdopterin-dependent oxidoreductase YjgC